MTVASDKVITDITRYLDGFKPGGKPLPDVFHITTAAHKNVVNARNAKKYVLKRGEDKEFSSILYAGKRIQIETYREK